jgi:hypothetical protein
MFFLQNISFCIKCLFLKFQQSVHNKWSFTFDTIKLCCSLIINVNGPVPWPVFSLGLLMQRTFDLFWRTFDSLVLSYHHFKWIRIFMCTYKCTICQTATCCLRGLPVENCSSYDALRWPRWTSNDQMVSQIVLEGKNTQLGTYWVSFGCVFETIITLLRRIFCIHPTELYGQVPRTSKSAYQFDSNNSSRVPEFTTELAHATHRVNSHTLLCETSINNIGDHHFKSLHLENIMPVPCPRFFCQKVMGDTVNLLYSECRTVR